MSEKITLHFAPDNASLVIRIALNARGVPFEDALVDRRSEAQQSAAYLALNPLGMIPALETPHGAFFETGAILLWLSERYGGLLPAPGHVDRGRALTWLFFLSNSLHAQLRQMFYPTKFVSPEYADALRASLAPRVCADFSQIDRLAGQTGPFGQPDCLGLDIYAACLLRFAQLYPKDLPQGWVQPETYPHLQRLCAHLETLPATQAAIMAEGLGQTPFTDPTHANPPVGTAT